MRSIGHFIGGKHVAGKSGRHAGIMQPMDGTVWRLYRSDDVGLLDPYRQALGGRPVFWEGTEEFPAAQDGGVPGFDDSEEALTQRLTEAYTGDGGLLTFGHADYDGDGRMEAFALMGVYDDGNMDNTAELWYVCGDGVVQCERAGGYYPFDCCVTARDGRTCYRVSEGYFGSGGAVRFWTVKDGSPCLLSGEYMLEDRNCIG